MFAVTSAARFSTQYCNAPASTAVTSSVLVTDEAGHWRRSETNGLGQLVEVDEPNSTSATVNVCPGSGEPIWVTTYGYDGLNDLTSVVQSGSRNRGFSYNSLQELITSNNPESGQINYTYDADGNVGTKTDGRTITSTYSYDVLNRATQVSYNDNPQTPTVTYTYDQPTCIGQSPCYNIGHRTTMTDAGGTESISYDKMGREWGQQRTTNGATKTTAYTYDFAGDLTTLTYFGGRTVTYTYDSAGRPSDLIDIPNSINYVTGSCPNGAVSPSTGVCYSPQGAIAQMTNGSNLTSTYLFNTRLQPCWVYTTTGSALATNTGCTASDPGPANILDLQYNFNLGHDNGNVMGITNNRNTLRSQAFSYDQVNRIVSGQSAATYSTGASVCWGESYSYDQWANLYANGVLSSSYNGCVQDASFTISPTSNNQFAGYSYDSDGNILNDGNAYAWNAESEIKTAAGVNYTYDGDGQRIEKSNGKIYWYDVHGQILDESDLSGNNGRLRLLCW